MPKGTIPYFDSAFPLASIATEERQFTYAVSMPISKLYLGNFNIEELETGADAIEIVLDDAATHSEDHTLLEPDQASRISKVVGHIRRNIVIPIIYHVPWPSHGILHNAQTTHYLKYISHGLRLAPEYITVDLRLEDHIFSQIVRSKKKSKVIGVLHLNVTDATSWKDTVWLSYYRRARDLGCDLVRFSKPATKMEDNSKVNCVRSAIDDLEEPAIPLISFNTGPLGRNSQCFNLVLTPILPASYINGPSEDDTVSLSVPPSITAAQATTALHTSFIYDAMKLYVIGGNVGYSMSPVMHNKALEACGIPHVYRPYSTDSLWKLRELVNDPLFAGASISLPFKVGVIGLIDFLSIHAKAIGAVNTLIPIRDLKPHGSIPNIANEASFFNGRNRAGPVLALYGENTDWIGMRAYIRRGLSPANAVRSSTSGLVVGAGGMARAAVYSMLQLGVKNIAIFNRTISNAEKLVTHFTRLLERDDLPLLSPSSGDETHFHILRTVDDPWPEHFHQPTMVVSCIPTHGTEGSPAPQFILPTAWMQSPTGGVVVQYAYKTLNTPLLDQARAEAHRGWVAMDGLDLLPEQGFAQFELFTGRRAPRRLMRREVFRSYPDEQGLGNQRQLQPRLEKAGQEP